MSSVDTYVRRNAAYAAAFSKGELPSPPSSGVTIVTCMDARIETGVMLGLEEGEVHVLRNAGGVVTDDVIRSLAISQRMLGTREIMVIHHTGCGLCTFDGEEFKDAVEKETGVRPPFSIETFADVEEDVLESIGRIRASPVLPHTEAVRGFVYEVETGRLREVA